jgi:xanthine/uracil/vitamin C permease (AzgA family)
MQVIVPITNKIKRPISMTMRIGIGFFVQILALTSGKSLSGFPGSIVQSRGLTSNHTLLFMWPW